jgi:P pilus assembly chaperone PapD
MAVAAPAGGESEGVGTDRTRYIYPEGEHQTGVTLIQHAHSKYLVQAWVPELDEKTGDIRDGKPPFFLKQPLVKTVPGGSYGFQVVQTAPVKVSDRESVYLLSFKFIPAEVKAAVPHTSRANVVMIYNVKLFYRPKALKDGRVAQASQALTFSRQGDVLRVTNPTPYWITFYSLDIGSAALPVDTLRRMVPPFDAVDYALPGGVTGSKATWRIIDEEGHLTKAVTSTL